MTLIALIGLIYAIIQIKSFLNTNFVENDTQVKRQLNDFLNGKQPVRAQKIPMHGSNSTGGFEATVEIKKEEMDQIQETDKEELDNVIQNTTNQ